MKYRLFFFFFLLFQLLSGQIAIRYRYNEVYKEKLVIFTDQIV